MPGDQIVADVRIAMTRVRQEIAPMLQTSPMLQTRLVADASGAIGSASARTEATFLAVGETLETSIENLAKITSSFETVLLNLEGQTLEDAIAALTRTAAQVTTLGHDASLGSLGLGSLGLGQLRHSSESIARRISQMKASLKNVDCLAVNSKIAAASINATGMDFSTFADEIGRTLNATRKTLDNFAAELHVVRQHIETAHDKQTTFEKTQLEAASSIAQRLSATVRSVEQQHQRAARASG